MRASRRGSRKNGCSGRRCWSRRQSGGVAPVDDSTMLGPSALSRAQGQDYLGIHKAQHGGAAVSLAAAAPVGYTGVLDDNLRAFARVTPLDSANAAIQGMSDQSGGGRRRRGRKGPAAFRGAQKAMTRRLKKIKFRLAKLMKKLTKRRRQFVKTAKPSRFFKAFQRRMSRHSRRGRRSHRGGGGYQYANQADYGAPGMLLSPGQERQALMGMNPEWKLAADPQSFAPRMS